MMQSGYTGEPNGLWNPQPKRPYVKWKTVSLLSSLRNPEKTCVGKVDTKFNRLNTTNRQKPDTLRSLALITRQRS